MALEIIGPVLSLQALSAHNARLIAAEDIEDVGIRDPNQLLLSRGFKGSEGGGEPVEPFRAASVDQ